jgi:hypothetical protein
MLMKKYTLLSLVIVALALSGTAQNKSINKKRKNLLRDAQYYLDGEDYFKAWQNYRELLSIDPKNELASVNGALAIFKLNYSADSALGLADNLRTSKLIDSKYYLAKILHKKRSFDEALALLEEYGKTPYRNRLHTDQEINYLKDMCINARLFVSNPHLSEIKNIGENINSSFPDYVPVIVPDESALYFTSKREGSSTNKKNTDNNYFEDIYVSHKENGVWKKAENAGAPLNSETNDGCVAISPDGQRMIVFRTATDLEGGDLYTTQIGADNKWEPLQLMNKEINSPYVETSACFSNDTSEIYFSSNRPGGYGGKDLYRIKKLPNGKWSFPLNLGPSVNTSYDEDAPFLHPDGVTLYYSSKGHNSMGEYDVFKSLWQPESIQFTQAENLGYPINDVGSDIFFVLSVDCKRGYYSSEKEPTFGGADIYIIDTRFGDNDLVVEEGYAFIDEQPSRVKVNLTDNATGQLSGTYYSNPVTGKFLVIANPRKSYKVLVESEGCDPFNMELQPLAQDKSGYNLEFKLKKNNAQ